MTSDSVSSQQVPAYFLQEASDLLQQMDHELQTLSQDFGVQKVYALMRVAHTLKGAAASVGLTHIKTTTHSLENVFKALCSPRAILTPDIESLIFESYSCLQLLLSAHITDAQIDEAKILDRMANIVAKLENHLGKRFGQDGYLPNSSELGIDITQSVFQKGVEKRLQELEYALETAVPENLNTLLRSHADVFSGLAESFNLPGFGDIVQTTLKALDHSPDRVMQIAKIALDDYRSGQRRVLEGDRIRGGEPSLRLKQLANSSKSSNNTWLGRMWTLLNQPILGTALPSNSPPTPTKRQPDPVVKPHATLNGIDLPSDEPLSNDSPISTSTTPASVISTTQDSSLKISIDHLDQINYVIGDLLTQQNRQTLYQQQLTIAIKTLLDRLGQQQQQLVNLQSRATSGANAWTQTPSPDDLFDALELDHYSELQLEIQTSLDMLVQQMESAEAIELFIQRSNQAVEKQQRLLKTLRETLVDARMQPIDNVFQRFHQVLDRLVAQQCKPIELKIEGGQVLVDKMIVDKLYEPLLHLVRNAFDHGIEKTRQRQQQGKLEPPQILLIAKQEGQHLKINIRDNGRGLNLESIAQQAIQQQLITPAEAQALTPAKISDLIFKPGFSTATQVSDLSGRGFGLDAVRAQIQALQGSVSMTSKPGEGTCFTLEIPTNLTIAKLLLCQTGETLYTFMLDAVEQILIPKAEQISSRNGNKTLSYEVAGKQQLVPIISLSAVLSYNATLPHNHWHRNEQVSDKTRPIILIRHQDHCLALESDQLLGEQELVIRSLGDIESTPAYIYGCSILADGRLSLVIDGAALTLNILQKSSQTLHKNSHSLTSRTKPNPRVPGKQSILVVDDSITVRNTLTKGLEKAGYAVIQAKEGVEALQKLKQSQITAILCDLEMPGMNGFDFLRARQRVPDMAAVPTIMLTSRTGDKHRQLANDLGANNYLTKPYSMPKLLETIHSVVRSNT